MDRKLIYTDAALADLEQVTAWSWECHPDTTERFMSAVLNHIELLAQFPSMGTPVKNRPGVRQLLHTPLRVYYRFDEQRGAVEVLHIRHGSRELSEL